MVFFRESNIDIHFITGLFTDQLVFKGINKGMASDGQGIIGSLSAIKCLTIYKSLKVDNCNVIFLDLSVFYCHDTGILLTYTVNLRIDICCQYLNFLFFHLNSLVISQLYLWLYCDGCCKYKRLIFSDIFHINLWTGYDLKTTLLRRCLIGLWYRKISGILIEDFRTIKLLDHFSRRFSFAEALDRDLTLILMIGFDHSRLKILCTYLYRDLCHTVFKILYFVTHVLIPPYMLSKFVLKGKLLKAFPFFSFLKQVRKFPADRLFSVLDSLVTISGSSHSAPAGQTDTGSCHNIFSHRCEEVYSRTAPHTPWHKARLPPGKPGHWWQ